MAVIAPGLTQQHVEGSFSTCRSQLPICMSVSLFYHLQRQNIGATHHIPEALPPPQCYSYTTDITTHMPTAGHLARKTVGSYIWASDLESVQELNATLIRLLEDPCAPDEHNSETRSFPSMLPHYPKP